MNDFFELMEESETLEAKLFSLIRIKILHSLYQLYPEGASFREFSTGMRVQDGLLYTNLNVLIGMGLIRSEKVKAQDKTMESYYLTEHGREEWSRTLHWIRGFICREE